jgi:hypothetical protein
MISEKISPVIVMGMHRSGTSLLSELLKQMGIFMGADWEDNKESKFFLEINEWLLKQAGVCWQEPKSFVYVSADFKKLMAEIILNHFKTRSRFNYLGQQKSYKSITDIDFPWGWKDPRNTFTREVWKEIFPDAKLIHLYRHPVDVIRSLVKRENDFLSTLNISIESRTGLKKKYMGYRLPEKRLFFHSFRTVNIQGAFDMWKEYVEQALTINENNPQKILHVCYEDLVEDMERVLTTISSFLEIPLTSQTLEKLKKAINPGRHYAYLESIEYKSYYDKIKNDPLVVKLGYHKI